MMQENPLSADQMTAVLEDAPVAILISSVDDWAPLYANRQARELGLHQTGLKGAVCFGTEMEPHLLCAGQQMNRPSRTAAAFLSCVESSPIGTAEQHIFPT